MTAEARIEEIAQAYEELTGLPAAARVRFFEGGWSGTLSPAKDPNHPLVIKASADTLETVIAAMGTAVLALAKAGGRV
jgi:hypothetical protein